MSFDITADTLTVTADTSLYTADGGLLSAGVFNPASLRNPNTTLYEIPLSGAPQVLSVDLPGGTYRLRLTFAAADQGGWVLDIADENSIAIVCGIPLVTGLDLLGPYKYLGIGGRLFISTAGDPSAAPGFTDLGVRTKLYLEAA